MPRLTHDDDGRTYACPECGEGGDVYERTHRHRDYDDPYSCQKCGSTFDEPVDREIQGDHIPPTHDDDGIPHGLDPAAKELIRDARGSES